MACLRVPLLLALLALAACTNAPRPPYPGDAELLDRFRAERESFDRLLAEPEDSVALTALGITRATLHAREADTSYTFQVWYQDLFGPGGCAKGFVYQTRAPTSVVDSIGPEWDTCPPEDTEIFRHLEGNWYLYYRAVN